MMDILQLKESFQVPTIQIWDLNITQPAVSAPPDFYVIFLKTINIPVLLVERCGHALPHFVYDVSHDFYLSHGDDPYNNLYKHNTPKFIPLELIIDHYKFDEWFNINLPEKTICNNIGRRALELAVEYIPNEILKIYCDDISKDKKPKERKNVQ